MREGVSFEHRFRHQQNAPERDEWIARDKALHVGASFLITLSSQYVFVQKKSFAEDRALPLSIGVSAAAGLGKEVYDYRFKPSHHFCARDLVADGVGIALAIGVILL